MNGADVVCHCIFWVVFLVFFSPLLFLLFPCLVWYLCLAYQSLLVWEPHEHLGESAESLYWSLKEFSTTRRGREKVLGLFGLVVVITLFCVFMVCTHKCNCLLHHPVLLGCHSQGLPALQSPYAVWWRMCCRAEAFEGLVSSSVAF